MMTCSIIEYYAEHERYKCGYCKKSDTSYSHGLWAHTMTVSDYQDLIDRGWRRSGKYCYKPTLDVTCCPAYTIRCKSLEFKATKSQKKILKRVNKYLAGDAQQSESGGNRKMSTSQTDEHIVEHLEEGVEQFMETKRDPKVINIKDIVNINSVELSNVKKGDDAAHPGILTQNYFCNGFGAAGSAAPLPLRSKSQAPMSTSAASAYWSPSATSLSRYGSHRGLRFATVGGGCSPSAPTAYKNTLGVGQTRLRHESFRSPTSDLIPGSSNDFSVKKDAGIDPTKTPCRKAKVLRRERRLEKLKDKGIDITMLTNTSKNKEKQLEDLINELPDNVKHKLEVKLVRTTPPSAEWLATAKETHEVYVKYQMKIHGDTPEKCTEPKFRDFLVQSPLLEEYSEVGPPSGYGSFHQQYTLDGKIIAVGVIDILPKCVSSVYFFYDPDYMNLTLGTYGALREIAFTRHLHSLCPELKYYYLGFYIHSCQKMRYKGNFHPSDLLCPETYKWFPIKDCLPKLNVTPYSRLDPDIDSVDENYPKPGDINYIPILFKGSVVPYKLYKKKVSGSRGNTEELMDYIQLVGSKTAKKLVLVR